MNKITIGLAAACILTSATASAANLATGVYASTGTVSQDNGVNCSTVGLSTGSANNSVLVYPGAKKTGLILYVPAAGGLQLCNGFAAIPATGLANFTSVAQCEVVGLGGSIPPQPVSFTFTSTVTDANSAYGTTAVSIPAGNAVGGGCMATIATSIVRSGK